MFVCVSGGGCNGNIYGKGEGFGKKELICVWEREREMVNLSYLDNGFLSFAMFESWILCAGFLHCLSMFSRPGKENCI